MPTQTRRHASVSRPRGDSRGRFAEIQRSRLLSAAVRAVDELGYADTSVADVTTRARVSRRTFYELFADREACLAAALEDALGAIRRDLAAIDLRGLAWRERVRTGLWLILASFDREPALARVCVVQALRGGSRVLERREAILAQLAAVIDEGRHEGRRGKECTPLTAEGLVGAAFAIVYARLLKGEREPLTGLLGELMGMIVLPYLGPAAARREHTRPAPTTSQDAALAADTLRARLEGGPPEGYALQGDPLQGVPVRLTYRTARVLESVAELGGQGSHPSNRMVAECAGVSDQGQISKHLRRLERAGLLANTGEGHAKGEPNAWTLTPLGERLARSIRVHGAGALAATRAREAA
jgi:AcrR family transcriptional regulator